MSGKYVMKESEAVAGTITEGELAEYVKMTMLSNYSFMKVHGEEIFLEGANTALMKLAENLIKEDELIKSIKGVWHGGT